MLLYIEVIGWAIILIELVGQKGRLERFVDALHHLLVRLSSNTLRWGFRHKYWFGVCFCILIWMFQMMRPDMWFGLKSLHPDLAAVMQFIELEGERQNSIIAALVGFAIGMIVLLPIWAFLKLLYLHPSGVLSAIGVVMALGSSILTRLI